MDVPGLIPSLLGAPLAAADDVVGTVEDLLVCPVTGRLQWMLVRLSDCARPYTFVPTARMVSRHGAVAVPFDEDVIRAAPVRLSAPAPASSEDAVRLSRHYGLRTTRFAAAEPLHGVRPALALAS